MIDFKSIITGPYKNSAPNTLNPQCDEITFSYKDADTLAPFTGGTIFSNWDTKSAVTVIQSASVQASLTVSGYLTG